MAEHDDAPPPLVKPDPDVNMDDAQPAEPAATTAPDVVKTENTSEPETTALPADQPQSPSEPQEAEDAAPAPSADADAGPSSPSLPATSTNASAAEPAPAPVPAVTLSTEEEEAALETSGSGVASVSGSGSGSGSGNGTGTGAAPGIALHGESNGAVPPHAPTGPRAEAIPEDACETLYVHNLNERVQLPVLQQTLLNLFKPYRPLTPITAHRNVRMRGQAFVSFADKETANRARREVHEFPLYGRPMMLAFARGRADAVVVKKDGEEGLEEHKKARLEDKKRKRRDNPIRRKEVERRQAERDGTAGIAQPGVGPGGIPGLSLGGGGPTGPGIGGPAKKAKMALPDEYLPPNNILFIQNLPDGTTSEDLREVFEVHPGLVEIRTIPTKKDIAFIEYADEARAIVAKEALHNFKIDGEVKMKVTYARK